MNIHAFRNPEIKEVSTDTYTLLAADSGKILKFTHASGCAVTLPAGLPAAWNVAIFPLGGAAVVTAAGSVDINGTTGGSATAAAGYSPATLFSLAEDDVAMIGNAS